MASVGGDMAGDDRDDFAIGALGSHTNRGTELFRLVFKQDLEGMVAKLKHGRYLSMEGETSWFKIRNRNSSRN